MGDSLSYFDNLLSKLIQLHRNNSEGLHHEYNPIHSRLPVELNVMSYCSFQTA